MDEELVAACEKLKISGKIVVVEGIKDERALRLFGIKNIVTLSRKPLFQIVEEVSAKTRDVVILTDLDRKGKELYGKLNSAFQREGVKVDDEFRNFLFRNTKIRQIEGLGNYAD